MAGVKKSSKVNSTPVVGTKNSKEKGQLERAQEAQQKMNNKVDLEKLKRLESSNFPARYVLKPSMAPDAFVAILTYDQARALLRVIDKEWIPYNERDKLDPFFKELETKVKDYEQQKKFGGGGRTQDSS